MDWFSTVLQGDKEILVVVLRNLSKKWIENKHVKIISNIRLYLSIHVWNRWQNDKTKMIIWQQNNYTIGGLLQTRMIEEYDIVIYL
jgi:hypothetical protein